jgi:hypothetical protein
MTIVITIVIKGITTSIELSNSDTVTSSKTLSVDVIQTGDANDNQLMGDDADNIIRVAGCLNHFDLISKSRPLVLCRC